jgi:hypothetical protein
MQLFYNVLGRRKRGPAEDMAVDCNTGAAAGSPTGHAESGGPATAEFVMQSMAGLLSHIEKEDRRLLLEAARRLGHGPRF